MQRLSSIVLLALVSVSGCSFEPPSESRVLLSVTSEVSVDQVTVLAATVDDVIFQEAVEVDASRDLDAEPLGISLDAFLGLGSPLDVQVSGYRDGALVAIHHAPFTIPAGGVMTVRLTAIAAECDADGDGTLDCTIDGCCDDAPVPEVFADCAPDDDAVGPGVEEACNGIDDDCDDQIDEFACADPTDVLVDVPPVADVPLTDTALTDLGPVEEVIAPEDATPDVEDIGVDVDADGATPPCTPDCAGLACGDDGCGGSCGACVPGMKCSAYGGCIPLGMENVLRGDVTLDAVVDGADVTLLQAYLDGEAEFDAFQLEAAQVDCVGEVDADDVALLSETIDGVAAGTLRYFETCAQYEICELDTCVPDTLDGVVKGDGPYCCDGEEMTSDAEVCGIGLDSKDSSLVNVLVAAWFDDELGGPGQAPYDPGTGYIGCDSGEMDMHCSPFDEHELLLCGGPAFPAWANVYHETLALLAAGASESSSPTIDARDSELLNDLIVAVNSAGGTEPGPFHRSWFDSEVTVSVCADGDYAFCGEVPQCAGIQCGPDPSGIPCGDCPSGWSCEESACVVCTPACDGADCGDDGCGGSCGACAEGQLCNAGVCEEACTPACDGLACGEDGCGGSCGECADGALCTDGQCVVCTPDCTGRDCGGDGCGGSCGECGDDAACSYWGQCEVTCAGNCSCEVLCGSVLKCYVDNCIAAISACQATGCAAIGVCIDDCGEDEGCQAACIEAAAPEDLVLFEEIGACQHTYCAPDELKTCDTTCDGVDDDCDGVDDDDYVSEATTCGQGACAAEGVTSCAIGNLLDSCEPGEPALEDLCGDDVDNDCDGVTDGSVGDLNLDGDAFWSSCDCNDEAAAVYPDAPELCDGQDNDCDGLTDEDFKADGLVAYTDLDGTTGLVLTDACGVGACAGGEVQCTPDGFSLHCTTYESAIKELCDGLDNDCDGATDEEMACYALIHPVTFTMGSPSDEACRDADETQHEVTLTRSYWLKTTEVTQSEWSALMGNEPSDESPGCDSCPVENVSWWEALAYCNALSIAEGLTPCYTLDNCSGSPGTGFYNCTDVEVDGSPYDCDGYRLPTEAEWEWAARAGTTTATYGGDFTEEDCEGVPEVLEPIAWYRENSSETTQPVGGKAPNPWGLYDMLGNVWEWTWDARGNLEDYAAGPAQDPAGAGGNLDSGLRVWRGCAYDKYAKRCRSANRGEGPPNDRESDVGFRIARTVNWPGDFPDGDSIGVGDNCPFVANDDQTNEDGDDYGAACDCDDLDPLVNPGIPEACDGIDNDCDGQTDEAAIGCVDHYTDLDDDGFGDPADSQCLCWPTAEYPVFVSGDCAPDDPLVFPQSDEDACNAVDDDCDGETDEEFKDGAITYIDYDGAEDLVLEDPCGQGVCVSGEVVCSADGEDLACSTDDLVTEEVCDDLDNDCDGVTDEGCVDADDDGVLDFKEPPGCLDTPTGIWGPLTVTAEGCLEGDLTQDGCISYEEYALIEFAVNNSGGDPFIGGACDLDLSGDGLLSAIDKVTALNNIENWGSCAGTTPLCASACAAHACLVPECGDDGCGNSCGSCPVGEACGEGVCDTAPLTLDCLQLHETYPEWPDGLYTIDPDGDGGNDPFEVYCDMTTSGGGWTLAAVSSDDGQHTWTWANRAKMANNTAVFGSLDERDKDFKSVAYNRLPFSSLLFVHSTPDDPDHKIWAQYAPGDDSEDLGSFIGSHGENINYKNTPGIPMTAGTLTATGLSLMCSTDLYINPCGLDGGSSCTNDDNTYGPAWSMGTWTSCPLDDPAIRGSIGPRQLSPSIEYYHNYASAPPGVGFGVGLELNTGPIGSATDHISIYVRRAICGDNSADSGEECDDGNDVDDDGCNAACELSAPLCEVDLDTAPDGFVAIPAGTFTMGSPETEPCRDEVETAHEVMLTRSFWLKATEVTQHEWFVMMGNDPSQQNPGSATHPVESINWYSALAYCNALSQSEDLAPCYTLTDCTGEPGEPGFTCGAVTTAGSPLDCEGYRLPTEAEWEVAARATTTEATYNGDIPVTDCVASAPVLDPIAWYTGNSGATTHAVGGKDPNAWGLYDMLGNVWEWTWDSWDSTDYDQAGAIDPIAFGGVNRTVRGGSWHFEAKYARSAYRVAHDPMLETAGLGLRVARTVTGCQGVDADVDGVLDINEPAGCLGTEPSVSVTEEGCPVGDLTQDGCITDAELELITAVLNAGYQDWFVGGSCDLDLDGDGSVAPIDGLVGANNQDAQTACTGTTLLCESGCANYTCIGKVCGSDECGTSCGTCAGAEACDDGVCLAQ